MMQVQRFSGMMNLDDNPLQVLPSQHIYARNLRFYGGKDGLIAENIRGNQLISNPYVPTGNNECIGAFYDGIKQRIIWFNYNSQGKHGIYQYKLQTKQVSRLLVCFTNSTTDILGFSLDYPIASVNIIYGSDDVGDTIYWCARNGRPMKLNLKDAEANLYGVNWLTDYLTVARQMPLIAPTCAYADDNTVNINNLRKKLYQFRYRFVYKDFSKSTWSPYSKLFAPANPDDIVKNINEQKNNRIDVVINTGGADVVKIEIAARQTLETTFSDCFLVATLDKTELSLLDNQLYTYKFYNNGSYPALTDGITVNGQFILESNLLFDYVPKKANCQELLNGNVIIYGGITEGYNFSETLNISTVVSSVDFDTTSTNLKMQIVNQNVNPTGSGTWNISTYLSFTGTPNVGDVYTIPLSGTLVSVDGSPVYVTYTVVGGDTLASVVNSIKNLITTKVNFLHSGQVTVSIVSTTNIQIVNAPPGGSNYPVYVSAATYAYNNPNLPVDGVSNSIYKHKSKYGFGLVYFDEFGVTNGVVTQATMLIETPEVTTTGDTATKIPKIHIEINHQPPIWAKKFSFVRTANLSVQSLLSTVSCSTKKDSDYGYIEITNQQNNQNNFSAYEFTDGDRVRIIGKYATAVGTVYDFPIQSYKTNPVISGVTTNGEFILVPYNSVLANFGTSGYDTYDIEIYTPAANTSPTQQVYYEFGETYEVLNTGTSTRAHQGQAQDQIVGGGAQPAKYDFFRGDFYIKQRKIPFAADLSGVNPVWIIDQSVSDLFPSQVVGNGRAFVIDVYAKENYFPTMVRWSLAYQQDTSINQTNRFYPTNFDEVDRAKGDIQRLKTRDRILRVFQNRGCGQYGIYARFIQTNDGSSQLVTTDSIITANNISYYQGEYGMGDQYTSLVSGSIQDYFCDPVRGIQCRLSGDGIIPISVFYKGQYEIRSLLTPYNLNTTATNGSRARIIGCYDFLEEQCVQVLKGYSSISVTTTVSHAAGVLVDWLDVLLSGSPVKGFKITISASDGTSHSTWNYIIPSDGMTIESVVNNIIAAINASGSAFTATKISSTYFTVKNLDTIAATTGSASVSWGGGYGDVVSNSVTFGFNEPRNAYSSFFDIYPEWMVSAEDVMYAWHNGSLYSHDSDTYCNFFGTQYEAYIDVVFNQNSTEKKTWIALAQVGSTVWDCPMIYSNVMSYGSQRQQTSLVAGEFTLLEGMPSASIKRDVYSKGGKINGNAMKGNYLVVRFRKVGATNLCSLSEVIAKYIDSPPNK